MSFSYVLADQHSLQSAFHTCKLSPPSHQHIHVCALIPYRVFVGGGVVSRGSEGRIYSGAKGDFLELRARNWDSNSQPVIFLL